MPFLSLHPLCILWQARDLRALKLDVNSFMTALGSVASVLFASVLFSLVYCSAPLRLLKWMRPGGSESPWLLRKENGFLGTSILVHKTIYGLGNLQGCQDLSCLLPATSTTSVSPALENIFRLAGWD